MIDSATLNAYPTQNAADTPMSSMGQPRLHMRRDPDDRMAGSIPVWENPKHAAQTATPETGSFDAALNYADAEPAAGAAIPDTEPESFGFGDLIDIVNPLHHIPLVNHLYESVTGDTIKPSGRIIGGAIFGGVAGAAAGIANVIVEEETGKDLTGNMVALVTKGDLPQTKSQHLSPEQHLDQAARVAFNEGAIESEPLPALAFSPQPATTGAAIKTQPAEYERYSFNRNSDDDRMAGTMTRRKHTARVPSASPLPFAPLSDPASINLAAIRVDQVKSAITEIKLSPLPRD
jgi:hypothetical protein